MNVIYEIREGMKEHYRINSKTETIYLVNTKDPNILREAKRTLEYCIK